LLLGLAYFGGDGVKKDAGEGAKWCRKAAEQGEPRAEYMLASAYEAGIGVPKDPAQALDWYRKALAHGYEQAKADIARLEPSVSQGGASAGQARTRRSPPSGMP
jgi:TPR repeat protein